MVTGIITSDAREPIERRLADLGIFYLDEVSTYLNAIDRDLRGDSISMSSTQLLGWGKRGYFAERRNKHERRDKRYISFGELITTRMIAILRSYGITWRAIESAHDYVKSQSGVSYPFATKTFWTDDSDHPTHLYTVVDDRLVAADRWGQRFFKQLRTTKLVSSNGLEFKGDMAVSWSPYRSVRINPRVQGGMPCIEGTRVPTTVLLASYDSGYGLADVSEHFELTAEQVKDGIAWEGRLRFKGTRGWDERSS